MIIPPSKYERSHMVWGFVIQRSSLPSIKEDQAIAAMAVKNTKAMAAPMDMRMVRSRHSFSMRLFQRAVSGSMVVFTLDK